MTKFSSGHFSLVFVLRDVGVSKKALGNHFYVQIRFLERIFCFTLTLTSSFFGYFLVAGPLGGPKRVLRDSFGLTDSIGSFKTNICILTKNLCFSKG